MVPAAAPYIMDKKVKAFISFAHLIQPGRRASALAVPLAALLKIAGPRRDVARRNIMLCFPELSKKERSKLLAESYESMIWTGVEMLAWQKDPTLIDRMVVEEEGRRYIDDALAAGKGAIVFSGHLGNWELSAAWMSRHYPFWGVVRHSDNPFLKELIETLRERGGLRVISKDENMMKVVSLLRRNEIFGALSDQHGGGEGKPVPFFGQQTSTVCGPAAFSVLTGAPLIPLAFKRLEPFRFRLTVRPPIERPPKEMKRDDAINFLTRRVNEEYEAMIRSNPGQWLWQHRRFREIITD